MRVPRLAGRVSILAAGMIVALSACGGRAEAQDYNGDGTVGFDDFFTFAYAYNTVNTAVDLNGDGLVGFTDFYYFNQNFGKPASEISLVPPTTGPNGSAVPALDLDISMNTTDDGNRSGVVSGSGTTFVVQVFAKSLATPISGAEIVLNVDASKAMITSWSNPGGLFVLGQTGNLMTLGRLGPPAPLLETGTWSASCLRPSRT